MNRIVVFGPVGFDKVAFVKQLFTGNGGTGLKDEPPCAVKQSGIILDDLKLITKYYDANITVFIDEPEDSGNGDHSYEEWIAELTTDEMQELREQLQLVIVLYPDEASHNKSLGSIERLNDLFDEEHCREHPDCLQWDGEILACRVDQKDFVHECRQTLQCIMWRDMQLLQNPRVGVVAPREPTHAFPDETSITQFEGALHTLRSARARHSSKETYLSMEEKALVESVLDALVPAE